MARQGGHAQCLEGGVVGPGLGIVVGGSLIEVAGAARVNSTAGVLQQADSALGLGRACTKFASVERS